MVKGKSERRGSSGRGPSFERRVLNEIKGKYVRGFSPKEVQQQLSIEHQPAADYVGYRIVKGGYVADIIEITTANKEKKELTKQFEGARDLVVKVFREQPVGYFFSIYTNNIRLVRKFEANKFVKVKGDNKPVDVNYVGGGK